MARETNGASRNVPHQAIQADVIILGAGPAGLTAAYELSGEGVSSIVLERDSVVGGLAKTVDYKGHLFDFGGHRFYTKIALIESIWREVWGPIFWAARGCRGSTIAPGSSIIHLIRQTWSAVWDHSKF
jgi:cation diffusion facilitator CzcD-associated flavoprotein CzcO